MASMQETTYEIQPFDLEAEGHTRLCRVIAFDAEGEYYRGLGVQLEADSAGSFEAEALVERLRLVTNSRGRAFFYWHQRPRSERNRDAGATIKLSWEDKEPFVFVERIREGDPDWPIGSASS